MSALTTPQDGMTITRDTVFAPGVYFLPNGIEIAADGVALDGNGALLIGADFQGSGVRVNKRASVTIRNLRVERYYHGIAAIGCGNLLIEGCAITRTHEIAGPGVFLDVWLDRSAAYGGGILLSNVIDSALLNNDLQHQQNGALLYGCNRVEIARNNASYNSGYGFLLYESSDNKIFDNIADYCCRIYQSNPEGQRYHNGADAAALVIMCSSSRNQIIGNKLRSGGDGVFLGGFHKDQIITPCNDNLFERNDCSDSPNIAFEATFSQRNVFRQNKANNCNYGFWLGWSSENTVDDNDIAHNRIAGIAIEHGHHNTITANRFDRNRIGVQLWANVDAHRSTELFKQYFPEGAHSHATRVNGNHFAKHDIAVHGFSERGEQAEQRCHSFEVSDNTLTDNRVAVQFERVRDSQIFNNRIYDNVVAGIKLVGCNDVSADGNEMS
jgi:parallel beta-helix repeat protein